MCWSFEVSLFTWIVSTVVGLYLLNRKKRNDLVMGLLILTYSSIQLWESLMWYDQQCGNLNLTATKLAYFALWSHVMAIAIGLYFEYDAIIPLAIGASLMVAAYMLQPESWGCSRPTSGYRHLIWGFDPNFYMVVFAIAIALCLYYIKPLNTALIISALFVSSFILSYLYANGTQAVGSFWCWLCAFFCFVFIQVNNAKKM